MHYLTLEINVIIWREVLHLSLRWGLRCFERTQRFKKDLPNTIFFNQLKCTRVIFKKIPSYIFFKMSEINRKTGLNNQTPRYEDLVTPVNIIDNRTYPYFIPS